MDDGYAIAAGSIYQAGCLFDQSTGTRKMAVFKSNDDGKTWKKYALNNKDGYVKALLVHPKDKTILFAGGLASSTKGSESKLYKSTTGGETWTEITAFSISNNCINSLSFDPQNFSRMLAATTTGVYVSEDGGATWSAPSQSVFTTSLVADSKKPGRFFAGSTVGVWMSEDGGKTWKEMNDGLLTNSILCMEYDSKNSVLYAGTSNGGVMRMKMK